MATFLIGDGAVEQCSNADSFKITLSSKSTNVYTCVLDDLLKLVWPKLLFRADFANIKSH